MGKCLHFLHFDLETTRVDHERTGRNGTKEGQEAEADTTGELDADGYERRPRKATTTPAPRAAALAGLCSPSWTSPRATGRTTCTGPPAVQLKWLPRVPSTRIPRGFDPLSVELGVTGTWNDGCSCDCSEPWTTFSHLSTVMEGVVVDDGLMTISARTATRQAVCPEYGTVSGRVHGGYRRCLADMAVSGHRP
jgi:hypothetical protein